MMDDTTRARDWDVALDIVASAPPVAVLEERMTARVGRPRSIRAGHLLAAAIVCALQRRPLLLNELHAVLVEYGVDNLRAIGCGYEALTKEGLVWQVPSERTVRRLMLRMRTMLEVSEVHALRKGSPLSPQELKRNEEALAALSAALLDASIPPERRDPGHYAQDDTRVPAYMHPVKAKDIPTRGSDPDAYYMLKANSKGERTMVLGYEVHALVDYVPGDVEERAPTFLHRVAVAATNGRRAEVAVEVLTELARTRKVRRFVVDRGFSNALPDKFRYRLDELGISPVHDLSVNDRGPRGSYPAIGVRVVDGGLYCDAMPQTYNELGALPRTPNGDDPDDFHQRLKEREKYGHRPHAARNSDGTQRFSCPARRGSLACDNVPEGLVGPADNPVIIAPLDPSRSQACSQHTFTVPPEVGGKLRQDLPWGSLRWYAHYKPGRAASERAFSLLKDHVNGGLDIAGRFRLSGRTARVFQATIFAVVSNIRRSRAWIKNGGVAPRHRRAAESRAATYRQT